MSTVAELIDRIYREFLRPPSQRLPSTSLTGAAMTDSSPGAGDNFTYVDGVLTVEEEDEIGPGTLLEFEAELIRVRSHTPGSQTIEVDERGAEGTTPAAHVIGTRMLIEPEWSRQTVFDATADSVQHLNDNLYRVGRIEGLTPSQYEVEIDAGAVAPIEYRYQDSFGRWWEHGVEILYPFPSYESESAVQWVRPVPHDAQDGYLVYQGLFPRPTQETDDLNDATFGVEREWERIIVVDAAAYLVAGLDLKPAHQDFISEQLAAQNFPVRSGSSIQRALLNYREYLITQAKHRLRRYQSVSSIDMPLEYRL